MRRLATVLAATLAFLLPASAASADPAGPTNYRTTIVGIEPDVTGISLEVFGGDSFLVLEVDPGIEVLVYGYAHDPDAGIVDPYLRFSADGTVESNRRSPAHWLNQDRYAAVEQPDFVDPAAPPDWEVVATDGRWAWHDHRIHWMSPALPPTIDEAGGVQAVYPDEQPVPFRVGDREVTALIVLEWEPSPSPLPWAVVALVAAGIVAAVARGSVAVAAGAVGGAAVAALAVGLGAAVGLPPGVGWILPPILLPVVALGAVAVARTREGDAEAWLLAGAGAVLVGWAVTQLGALTSPIVPSRVPVVAIRAATGLAAGVGLGLVVAAALRSFGGDLSSLADLADRQTDSTADREG